MDVKPTSSRRIKIHRKSILNSTESGMPPTDNRVEKPSGVDVNSLTRNEPGIPDSEQLNTDRLPTEKQKTDKSVNDLFSGFLAKKLELIEDERRKLEESAKRKQDNDDSPVTEKSENVEIAVQDKAIAPEDAEKEEEGECSRCSEGDDATTQHASDVNHQDNEPQSKSSSKKRHHGKDKKDREKKHKHKHKKEHKKKDKHREKDESKDRHKDRKRKGTDDASSHKEKIQRTRTSSDERDSWNTSPSFRDHSSHERDNRREVHRHRGSRHYGRESRDMVEPLSVRLKSRQISHYDDLDMWDDNCDPADSRKTENGQTHKRKHKHSSEKASKRKVSGTDQDVRVEEEIDLETGVEKCYAAEETKALAKIKKLKESVQSLKASISEPSESVSIQKGGETLSHAPAKVSSVNKEVTVHKLSIEPLPPTSLPSSLTTSKPPSALPSSSFSSSLLKDAPPSKETIVISDSEDKVDKSNSIKTPVDLTDSSPKSDKDVSSFKPPCRLVTAVSTDEDSQQGSLMEKPKKPVLKFGAIKISTTSMARISGVQVDEKDEEKGKEEGEVSNSEPEDNGEKNAQAATEVESKNEKLHPSSSSSADSEGDSLDTDGSIADSDPEPGTAITQRKEKRKHKKKGKKKKKSKKSHRSSKDDKEGKTKKKHHSRYESSRKHTRSRSRSASYDRKTGVWKSRSRSRSPISHRLGRRRSISKDHDHHWRRSPSNDRYHDRADGYRRRSRSRSRSPRPFRVRRVSDERMKIDKAKLREIAVKNAYRSYRAGYGPKLDAEQLATLKAGGKSVEELTDFCKKISEKEKRRGSDSSDSEFEFQPDSGEDNDSPFIHHPFKVNPNANIVMNIRNAKQLPVLTQSEKLAQSAVLRLEYPVSSGSHHRKKEDEWVPVERPKPNTAPAAKNNAKNSTATTTAVTTPAAAAAATTTTTAAATTVAPPPPKQVNVSTPALAAQQISQAALNPTRPPVAPEDKVFPDAPQLAINISAVVSERISAMRKLQDNPNDVQAMSKMYKAQQQVSRWAESKHLPGQFTGSTGVQILSQQQLQGGNQAWLTKDTFTRAQPVKGGVGMFLLQRMGWKEGEGLGKNREGNLEPLQLDFKIDRKGLTSTGEVPRGAKVPNMNVARDLSGKHPVSALVELCSKRRWSPPHFAIVHESGPDHKKTFVFKVKINGVDYQSTMAANNKKQAKMNAATACLQELGLVPRS